MGGVHRQPRARTARQLRAAGQIEALAGEVAHLAHEQEPRPAVHLGGQIVHGHVVAAGADHAGLHAPLAQQGGRVDQRGVLDVREDDVVARAPLHRAHRLVQAFRRMGEEGDLAGLDAQQPRRAGARPLADGKHLLAPRHARALERAEPLAGGGVRPEPRRLAAGAEVRHAVEADELALVDQGHDPFLLLCPVP